MVDILRLGLSSEMFIILLFLFFTKYGFLSECVCVRQRERENECDSNGIDLILTSRGSSIPNHSVQPIGNS